MQRYKMEYEYNAPNCQYSMQIGQHSINAIKNQTVNSDFLHIKYKWIHPQFVKRLLPVIRNISDT